MSIKDGCRWIIPDMYWPEISSPGHYVSHESVCVVNTTDENCFVRITLYFQDREPLYSNEIICNARRTNHIRMDSLILDNDVSVPRGVPYAALVECSIPAFVQYTRVDTTQCENALMTTMAHPISGNI